MPKKKPDHEKAKKLSVSIPKEDWEFAKVRMFNGRMGPSEYIKKLIKEDTQDLWLEKHQPSLMAAEEPPPYGKASGNETAPPARHSKVSYRPGKTKGQES